MRIPRARRKNLDLSIIFAGLFLRLFCVCVLFRVYIFFYSERNTTQGEASRRDERTNNVYNRIKFCALLSMLSKPSYYIYFLIFFTNRIHLTVYIRSHATYTYILFSKS